MQRQGKYLKQNWAMTEDSSISYSIFKQSWCKESRPIFACVDWSSALDACSSAAACQQGRIASYHAQSSCLALRCGEGAGGRGGRRCISMSLARGQLWGAGCVSLPPPSRQTSTLRPLRGHTPVRDAGAIISMLPWKFPGWVYSSSSSLLLSDAQNNTRSDLALTFLRQDNAST